MGKNITIGKSLEDYKKKYKDYKNTLLSLSKKEVEEFDKTTSSEEKNALLRHRKWTLIGDTYYEIPRPIRWSWFKGLSGGAKLATCLLTVGVVGGAATGTYFIVNHFLGGPNIVINPDKSDLATISSKIDPKTGDAIVDVKAKEGKYMSGIEIKIGDKVLTENTDYNVEEASNSSITRYVVTIFKKTLETYKGKIVITPKEATPEPEPEFDGRVTEEQWNNALSYYFSGNSNRKFKCEMTNTDESTTILEVEGYKTKKIASKQVPNQYTFDDCCIDISDRLLIDFESIKPLNMGHIYSELNDISQIMFESYNNFVFSTETKSYSYESEFDDTIYNVKFNKFNNVPMIETFERRDEESSNPMIVSHNKYVFSNYGTHSISDFEDATNIKNISKETSGYRFKGETFSFTKTECYCCYNIDLSDASYDSTKKVLFAAYNGDAEKSSLTEMLILMDDGATKFPARNGIVERDGSIFEGRNQITVIAKCAEGDSINFIFDYNLDAK